MKLKVGVSNRFITSNKSSALKVISCRRPFMKEHPLEADPGFVIPFQCWPDTYWFFAGILNIYLKMIL